MSVEKEEKPKKVYQIVYTVWDDGALDTEIYHFKKSGTGRGAPGKWRLNAEQFRLSFEETLGSFPTIVADFNAGIGLNTIQAVKYPGVTLQSDQKKVETTPQPQPEKKSESKTDKKKKEESDDDLDMDFGAFDTEKDK
jgi:hypothetical protein